MTIREKQVKQSRRLISDNQLLAFLLAAKDSHIHAIKFFHRQLDDGKSLDEIFYNENKYEYSLKVKKHSHGTFIIDFGCLAGPDAGDGGSWVVTFNGDNVISIKGTLCWIS